MTWMNKRDSAEYISVTEAGFDRNVRPFIGTYKIGRTPIFKSDEIDRFMLEIRVVESRLAKVINLSSVKGHG